MTSYVFAVTFENNADANTEISVQANLHATALVKAHQYATEQNKGKFRVVYISFFNA
jgi:hypothetical protein